ncbi:MAG: hypothetical protein ACYC3A_05855 [Halothiobacillus sp.]
MKNATKTISPAPIASLREAAEGRLPALNTHPERRARLPQHETYALRLTRVRDALFVLQRHGIDVIDIDINRPRPIISIPSGRRNNVLGQAWPYQLSHDQRGRVRRYQVLVEGCRVEFDQYGH